MRPQKQLAGPAGTPAFVLAGVHHSYRPGAESLSGISFAIEQGEHVAIVGANGSGKSTLLKMLDGLVFASEGELQALGRPLTEGVLQQPAFRREFRSQVGFVFQQPDVQLFCPSVFDELAFGPLQLGLPDTEVRGRIARTADALRLGKLLGRAPYTLSGGEKKRVAIGSVLTMEPSVLLLDEPTNDLDPRSQVWLLEVLEEWKAGGRTVVLSTHDLSVAAEEADRILVLSEDHVVVADGTPEEILAQHQLLLDVNLIHEHAHRHGGLLHAHPHFHGRG